MEKWWNVTFCLRLFHIQAVRERREDETDGNTFDNFYHTGFIFHVQPHFSLLNSSLQFTMLSAMSWVASLVFRSTSCLTCKVKQKWERKYFYSTILGDLIYDYFIPTFHVNPLIRGCVQRQEIPLAFTLCVLGWGILTWHDKCSEFHGEQGNVFVIFVKEDERDLEWNTVIEDTPLEAYILTQK